MDRIVQCDGQTLLKQAYMTAHEYLHEGIKRIDDELGEGYAKKNPQLLAAFINTCAIDYNAAIQCSASDNIAEAIEGIQTPIDNIAIALKDSVSEALKEIIS